MKQLYPTNFTFTFPLLTLYRNTGLFLLIFLLNFTLAFGQEVTISSGEPNPTQNNPIGISIEFNERINGFEESDVNVNDGNLSNFQVEWPEFEFTNVSERLNDFEVTIDFSGETDFSTASNSVIAIDIDNDGFIYALTLDEGVFKYDPNGSLVSNNPIVDADELNEPRDLAVDDNANIFIANSGSNQVLKFDSNGGNREVINSGLSSPSGLAISLDQKIYVADTDNDRVVIFNNAGSFAGEIDNGSGAGTEQLFQPVRLAVDNSYNVYVTDAGNNRIQIYNSDGNHINTIDGNNEDLRNPGSLVVDDYGFLYVADFEGVSLNTFLNFEDIEPLEAVELIFADHRIQVFRTEDLNLGPETIDDALNVPVDLALKPCGFLAVNNSDADGENFPTIKFIFDFKTYEILPTNFTAALEINEECISAEVSIDGEVGKDANCNSISASDTFSIIWDQTKPEVQTCYQEDQTVEIGDEIPNYVEEDLVVFEDNCEGDLEIEQTPAPGTEISQQTTTVSITATDEAGNVSEACTFDLMVEEENTPPVTEDDEYEIDQDETLTRAAPGVLLNDTDAEGDALTAEIVTQPENGTVTLNSDGSFTYEPNVGYFGTDTFTYITNDGEEDSAPATVTITVNEVVPVNRIPNALAESYTINQGEVLNIDAPGVLENDSDPDGDNLTAELRRPAAEGDFSFASNGSFTYEPDPGSTGVDDFIYVAYDGEAFSGEVRVTITVNEVNSAPVAQNDSYTTNQDEILNISAPGVLGNDEDEDEDSLTANLEDGATNGTLTLNSDGSFEYEPDDGFSGQDSFTYRANDGELDSNIATVTITVNPADPAAPKFEDCPTLIQRNVNTDECQARVDFDTPRAFDDSGELAVALVSDLGSGDLFSVGTTTVTYEATGENGETISCSFEVVVVDNMSPGIISCPDNIEIEIAADENSTPVTYTVPEFTDNCGVVDIQRNGPASGESFSLGRTVVTYTASDEEGNEISCSFEVLVEREDEEPAEPEYRCIEEEDIPDIRLDENCEWEEPEYFRLIETENFTAEFTQTYEQLTENTLYFTIEIRNEANGELVGECSFSANIIDLMPPKITCPGDQVENFDPEEGFVIPDYENMASFSDNCGEVTFQQRPVPGEVIFEDTMVTLTAFDENGLATPCTFEIQLSQGNELNIGCQIDQNVNPDEDCRFTLPDYTDTGNLNFPEADVTQSPAPGTVISANTQITLTATLDRQTDECVFMVNLIDNEDPVANCASGYVVNLDESGNATLAPEVLDNNSTDNCGIISMGLSQTEFTRADIGEVPITLTVRDDAGNTDTCETTVEVVDEASGQFECRENVVVNLNENGEAVLSLQDLYTGNASGITLEASRLDFSCSDLGVVQIQLDYSGAQTGSCTINVEVQDEIPPVINTDIVELTLDDQGFAYLEESDVLAENNCGQQLIYQFRKSVFNCEDVGANTVNVEVEDANGNIAEKNIEVRVNGEACEIPDNEDLEFLFIYPNPNNGIFTIATPEGMLVEQVRVFDSRGRFILQKEYKDIARFYRMTIEGVAASVYTLQIFTNEGMIVKRVIISR